VSGLALAALALLAGRRDRRVLAIWLLGLLGLAVALGETTPLHGWLYRLVPGFDKVRAPGRALLFVDLAGALLVGFGVARLSRRLDLPSDFLLRAVKTGDIVPLADHDLSRNMGPLVLNVAVCPRCGPDAPVDVQVQQTTLGPRGEKKVHELAHVTYPGEAMRVLDALFEPPPRR
jgi:hypothetical protein